MTETDLFRVVGEKLPDYCLMLIRKPGNQDAKMYEGLLSGNGHIRAAVGSTPLELLSRLLYAHGIELLVEAAGPILGVTHDVAE